MTTLRIYLLGLLRLEVDGVPVSGFATQKARLLLAYLVSTAPKVHSRTSLAALFWPDSAPDAARYNLRYALWSIRSSLRAAGLSPNSCLKTDPETCQFSLSDDHWRDTDAFTQKTQLAAKQAGQRDVAVADLQDAVALYRGEFLEGVRIPSCTLLEEWLTFERERWRHLYLETLDCLVEALIADKDHSQAITHSREILRIDPLRESAHRQLMHLYWLTGQRSLALRQYETCRRLLHEELNVEPLAATQELYHRIRMGEPLPDVSELQRGEPPVPPRSEID
jgi:DNA-binding SARP family transcriptional activator